MCPSSMIELRGLRKEFPGAEIPAVAGLDLVVDEGETVVLVGPSGCGKTTTLKMINRLIEPTAGSIHIAGRDVLAMDPNELRRGIGYVIQQIGLFPHRTIAENIATVPRLLAWDDARIARRVEELVELVDLERSVLERYPPELSGGQRQRVGVARALAADPPILLMDEPFGAVDPIVRAKLQGELRELQKRLQKTIVLVTHDVDEAILLGDRVALLNVGGHLEQFDSPSEILRSPASGFVADFLGKDRGIKRLSLIPLSSVPLTDGPVVSRSSTTAEAESVMQAFGVDWVAIVEEGVLLGWMTGEDFARSERRDDLLLPFATTLDITDSLKEALDAVVTSHTSVAAVYDGDRYVGMVTIDAISAEIVQ